VGVMGRYTCVGELAAAYHSNHTHTLSLQAYSAQSRCGAIYPPPHLWHWKGMYKASEDEGDQRKDGSM